MHKEYALTELMLAVDRACKNPDQPAKFAQIYTKQLAQSQEVQKVRFAPTPYPLTALTVFPEEGIITVELPLESAGKPRRGFTTTYFSVQDINEIVVYDET